MLNLLRSYVMTPKLRLGIIALVAVLAVVAVAGWLRHPSQAQATYSTVAPQPAGNPAGAYDQYGQPVPQTGQASVQYGQAAPQDGQAATQYGEPSAAAPYPVPEPAPNPEGNGYEAPEPAALPAFATTHYVRVIHSEPAPPPEYVGPEYGEADRVYGEPARVAPGVRYVERRHVRHHRSFAKSAAIVAGSAGVGAAIGGIAGGGKGAGIGAIAGGAGGFIYDRLTRH